MPSATDTSAFLATVSLFADLSSDELRELSWTAEPFTCEAGTRLLRQGDQADSMFCIERGRVSLSMRMPGGDETVFRELGPGDFVGEMALIDDDVRSASATAMERTSGYRLPGRAFEVLRAARRTGALKVLRRVAAAASERLRGSNDAFFGEASRAAESGVAVSTSEEKRVRPLRSAPKDLDRPNLHFLPALRGYSEDELEQLLDRMHRVDLPRRHVIFREGDPPGSCFVVVRGAVEVSIDRESHIQKLALMGPGRLFGELALFSPHPRAATCMTREETILLELERNAFDDLFAGHSEVAFKFFDAACQLLVQALRTTNRRRQWHLSAIHSSPATISTQADASMGVT